MDKRQTVSTIRKLVENNEKFTMLTAYDATFSQLISSNGVETILIGDSLGMVIQGNATTVPVTMDDMVYHTTAVASGNQGSLLIADMPFNSYGSVEQTLKNAGRLMQAGAHMVKLEGGAWLTDSVIALSRAGIPTCLHLGLTPQSVNKFGGYKVQGREESSGNLMIEDAQKLVKAGADFILLECVPSELARKLTEVITVPVIGIGAGKDTDAQVLVCYDMLGLTQHKMPKFVKNYMSEPNTYERAIKSFVSDVKAGSFPEEIHSFE